MINLALQKRPDRAVGNRGMGLVAPIRFDPAFISGVKLPVLTQDAHIQMVVRQDLGDLGRDGADGRAKVQLAGQQSRDAEKMVQKSTRRSFDHSATLSQRTCTVPLSPKHDRKSVPNLQHLAQGPCGNPQRFGGFPQTRCLKNPIQDGSSLPS